MRWSAMQKVWSLCKLAFPKKSVWPEMPYRLSKEGSIKVFDMETEKPIGEIKYQTLGKKIVFRAQDFFEELPLEARQSIAFPVAQAKTSEFISMQKVGKLMSQNYEGEELYYQAAALYEQQELDIPFEQWLASNGFPDQTLVIAEKKKYKKYQRVRIQNPISMEYNEMGVILDIVGDKRKGFRYLVLVDGSSSPLWFDQKSLHFNLAGVIVNE